jgi:DNA repair exonuclease SbcCD ATPase subunit
MAFDPKSLVDATKKIEQHLVNYEKRRKDYDDRLAAVKKRLETLDRLTEMVQHNTAALLKGVAAASTTVQATLKSVEYTSLEKAKASTEYEMVQRRFLDSKKTWAETGDNLMDKFEAFKKNKDDKKAKLEYELAEKAATKIATDAAKLLEQAQEMVPSKVAKGLEMMTSELPKDVEKYEKALKELLEHLDWSAFREACEYMKRYGDL